MAVLLPRAWFRRILAVRLLRQYKVVPDKSVLWLITMHWPTNVRELTALASTFYTFEYEGQLWEITDPNGTHRPCAREARLPSVQPNRLT